MILTTLVVGVYLALWAYFIGPTLSYWGAAMVTNNGLTGTEAFFWRYANFFLGFLPLIIYLIAQGTFFGGGQ